MKKRIFAIFFLLFLIFPLLPAPARAAGPLLTDEADLLTEDEEAALLTTQKRLQSELQMDFVIVTVPSLGDKPAQDYADDFYDYGGYAEDGILLLVCMGSREWYIGTSGAGLDAVSENGLDFLESCFLDSLSDGAYYAAFDGFLGGCESLLSPPGGVHRPTPAKRPAVHISLFFALFSLAAGAVVATVITGAMKKQLKTVVRQNGAANYTRGALSLTAQKDVFLYRHVTRTERPRDTGGVTRGGSGGHSGGGGLHTSSSGRSHGGRGGRF